MTPFPNVFGYDQNRLASATNNFSFFDKGWRAATSLSETLTPGRGYTVNLMANQIVDFVGELNQTAVDVPLARAWPSTLPIAVASAGPASTGRPVRDAVRRHSSSF